MSSKNAQLDQARAALAKSYDLSLDETQRSVSPAVWDDVKALNEEREQYEAAWRASDEQTQAEIARNLQR